MNEKILIIRPDAIGDFIIFSAVLEEYKELFPGFKIDLLCHPKVKDIAIAIPWINKVYSLNIFRLNHKKYYPYLASTLVSLNLNRYDKIIYPVYSPVKEADDLIKLIRAKEKIAFDGDTCNYPANDLNIRKSIYSSIIDGDQRAKGEFDRNAEFILKLGSSIQGEFKTKFWFLSSDVAKAERLMRQEGLIEKKYVCLFPGAGAEIKYWNSQNWIELIKELLKSYSEYDIVLLGSGNDLKPIDQILTEFQDQKKIINLYGKTDVRLLAKIIEKSVLLVGMDTGPIHIAAAVNTPNICIIGGGHFGRFYPYGDLSRNRIVYHKMDCYGCNWKCIYDVTKCIKEISVADVLHEVEILINGTMEKYGTKVVL